MNAKALDSWDMYIKSILGSTTNLIFHWSQINVHHKPRKNTIDQKNYVGLIRAFRFTTPRAARIESPDASSWHKAVKTSNLSGISKWLPFWDALGRIFHITAAHISYLIVSSTSWDAITPKNMRFQSCPPWQRDISNMCNRCNRLISYRAQLVQRYCFLFCTTSLHYWTIGWATTPKPQAFPVFSISTWSITIGDKAKDLPSPGRFFS